MKSQHLNAGSRVSGEATTKREPYARESFTWRRMKPWQAWTLGIAGAVLAILGLIYVD